MFNAENQIQSALEKVTLLPRFAGVLPPSNDYDDTLRGLRRLPDYIDIDLSSARSIGALTALLIPISGNSFYIDQGATNGNATIHFQDSGLGLTCPFFVGAGFIAAFPFTQMLLENTAQAGKILRIIYGTDLKFQAAGVLSTAAIPGQVLNGTVTESARTPNKFISLNAVVVNPEVAIWTPAAGKKFRLMGYSLTQAVVSNSVILKDGGVAIMTVPQAPIGTPQNAPQIVNGILSSAANNVLTALGAATQTLTGYVFGSEE